MKIFVSHIKEEEKFALTLKEWIESTFLGQCDVFVSSDPEDIPAGDKWLDNIEIALNDSKLLIILYSPLSKTRPWINFEAGCGWIKKIKIMPVCHSGLRLAQIGPPISNFQGLEIDDIDFPDKFFGAIAKHAGFKKQPKIDKKLFLKEITEAIGSFKSTVGTYNETQIESTDLSKEQINILKVLAEAEDYGEGDIDEPDLARRVNLKVTLLIHHITPLKNQELVHQGLVMGGPNYYTITQKGISCLVNKGILK